MGADPRLMELPVPILQERIASGAMRAADLAAAAAAKVEAADGDGLAWFDGDYLRRQGAGMDVWRGRGRPLGALHGLPVTVGDLADTARIPTRLGTAVHDARVPERDAALVERLRGAGALIAGKGVVSPFGTGGSDGAATPVAARYAPAAVITSADGGAIAEAAARGVVGYRPTAGSIPMRGVFAAAPTLATATVLATDLVGAASVAEALFAPGDDAAFAMPAPPPGLKAATAATPPVPPTIAVVPPLWWDDADADIVAAFEELAEALTPRAFGATLPEIFHEATTQAHRIIAAESAKTLHGTVERHGDDLPAGVAALVAAGEGVSARDYLTALDWRTVLAAGLDAVLDRCDAVLTAVSPRVGEAGPADANLTWAFLGVPSVTLPLLGSEDGRAIGLQLISRKGDDARLLRTAAWLQALVVRQGESN
ncbi:amidase family protein [Acuticoccus sp. I52.16.1]|uniref:amidase family protein n=1 Tax=Acuticoccus sp. I52.16.1 TaxID=2928472 RepID=UPI001FD4DE69|nr:amidase family protein [Acuticoccus sp. I52.16.1]UOM34833.1 amidase [Acuticoccus sp. I52.16.1]